MVKILPRFKKVLKRPRKKERRLIAIDETKLKLEKKLIFVWTAIDIDNGECLQWASEGRSSFHAYVFLKEALKYCENGRKLLFDRGFFIYGFEKVGIEIQARDVW